MPHAPFRIEALHTQVVFLLDSKVLISDQQIYVPPSNYSTIYSTCNQSS